MVQSLKGHQLSLLVFFIIFVSVNSLCVQGYDNCNRCLNLTHCSSCRSQFGLNDQGYCVRCTDLNCIACSGNDPATCNNCMDYYQLNNSACVKSQTCSQVDCIHCPNSTSVCQQCDYFIPYIGLQNQTCVNCSIAHCKWCKQNAAICTYCQYGFGIIVINETMTCGVCSDFNDNCGGCWSNVRVCGQCLSNYGVDTTSPNGNCLPCASIQCQVCGRDYTVCTKCIVDYGLDQTGCQLCVLSQSFCLTCDPSVLIKCYTCPPQRHLVNDKCQCFPSNCYLCSEAATCDECIDRYYRGTDGQCHECPGNCSLCYLNLNQSSPQCTECVSSIFELDHSLPPVCQQVCGDDYNSIYPCENQVGIPYDGCDDNCQIQDNFTCSFKNMTNLTDVCKFTGIIQLIYQGYTKQKLTNGIVLKFQIFPPLYAFKITPQEDLIKIFQLSNKNITIKSITFDQKTGQFNFYSELIGDIFSNQSIYVIFQPSLASKSDYFLSDIKILTDFQFEYTIYYYKQIVFSFSSLILYVSYVLSALGWVSCILGFILRKLAGLQAMMVIQYSWLPILCFNAPILLPFQQTYPLIYSNGYNPHLSSLESEIQLQSPYLSYFNLSKSFFYDNWSIHLLFLIFAIISVMVTSIRLRRFHNQNPDKQNEDQCEQLDKLVQQKGMTYEWLMYICMFILTYFVAMSFLFFKLGNRTDIISIILFSIGAIVILGTFSKFGHDPYPFGYFRFSFNNKCLAMQHYFLVIVMTISSIVLLLSFSKYTYAALAPPLIILIYTLIHRPYHFLRDNLRHSFNLLTICSFTGLRVYIQFCSSQNLNTIPTYIYLVINIGLLLPCVAIMGIAFTIYQHCREKKQQQEQMIYRQTENGKKEWMRRNILKQLVGVKNYSQRVGQIPTKTVFKDVIHANSSLLDASMYLKNKQKYNHTSDRPLIVEETQQKQNSKYQQYKKQIKKEKIVPIKSITEKEQVKQVDKLVFHKISFDQQRQIDDKPKLIKQMQKQKKIRQRDKIYDNLTIQITQDVLAAQNRFIEFKAIEENVKKQKKKLLDPNFSIQMEQYQKIGKINIT